jgi:HK97 family phage major capsid protein
MSKETIEIDADTLAEISKQVGESLDIDSKLEASTKATTEAVLSAIEGTKKKSVADADDKKDAEAEKAHKADAGNPLAKESKEMRLFKSVKAYLNGNHDKVKAYRELAFEMRAKAGYASTTDDEDGGYLVPDPEFDTAVYDNLPKYGVAFQYADVRQTDRTAVKVMSLDSGLEFYATDEAGVKQGAKLQFSRKTVDLQKYAVIVPATDELAEDSAVDYWNLVTKELSRAYAKKADEVTFTDAVSGITNTTGVITEPVSGAGTTITWGDLLSAEGAGEDDNDTSGNRWFMRKETWFRLVATRADGGGGAGTGNFFFMPNPNQPTTPWGTPVTFTRVLPKSTGVGANDPFAVYGDLSNYILYNKRGMQLTKLTEAIVKDSEGTDFNLATQDGTAMRAVIRLLGVLPKGNASKFVVLGTGTVS